MYPMRDSGALSSPRAVKTSVAMARTEPSRRVMVELVGDVPRSWTSGDGGMRAAAGSVKTPTRPSDEILDLAAVHGGEGRVDRLQDPVPGSIVIPLVAMR